MVHLETLKSVQSKLHLLGNDRKFKPTSHRVDKRNTLTRLAIYSVLNRNLLA